MEAKTNKCSDCPHRFYPVLTGDCPMIKFELKVNPYPALIGDNYEPNQFCFISCAGSKREVELTKSHFTKIPDSYWRSRYLEQIMGWDYEVIYGR